MSSSQANFEALPMELILEIASYVGQHDVGSLRLVSRVFSSIGIQHMLGVFPIRLSFDGIARALALTESKALSQHVHTLTFHTQCEEQARSASSRKINDLTAKHRVMVDQLNQKYVSFDSNILHRELVDKRKLFGDTWPEHELRQASSDPGPVMWKKQPGVKLKPFHFGNPAMICKTLHILAVLFPKLERLYMVEGAYIYDWKFSEGLSIHALTPSSTALPRWHQELDRPGVTPMATGPARPARIAALAAGCWSKAKTVGLGLIARHKLQRSTDFSMEFILSTNPSAHAWPIGPRVESLEVNLPAFHTLNHVDVFGPPLFKRSSTKAYDGVKRLSLKYSHVEITPGRPQRSKPTTTYDATWLGEYAIFVILSDEMDNLETLKLRFPYGYLTAKDALHRRNGFLVSLQLRFTQPYIYKLDLGFFATTRKDLELMLRHHRRSLRHLKLTRIDMTEGSWLGWFGNVRNQLGGLESAEFCEIFRERSSGLWLRMETEVPEAQHLRNFTSENQVKGEKAATRTIGSMLGEICLSRTPPDSPLRKSVLRLVRRNMW